VKAIPLALARYRVLSSSRCPISPAGARHPKAFSTWMRAIQMKSETSRRVQRVSPVVGNPGNRFLTIKPHGAVWRASSAFKPRAVWERS